MDTLTARIDAALKLAEDEGWLEMRGGNARLIGGAPDLLALLRECREAIPQWRTMESAPKDGSYVLLGNENGAWVGRYLPVYGSGYQPANPWHTMMLNHDHLGPATSHVPTHWQPLPPPPAEIAKGESK